MTDLIARIRRIEFTDAMIGGVIGFLIAGAVFSSIQVVAMEISERDRIERETLLNALHHAEAFQRKWECTMETIIDGCKRMELRVRP